MGELPFATASTLCLCFCFAPIEHGQAKCLPEIVAYELIYFHWASKCVYGRICYTHRQTIKQVNQKRQKFNK